MDTQSAGDREMGGLRRAISRPMLVFFVLGDILGAGIYALVGRVAGQVGGAVWASFLVAFALALVTAFAYAELVTKYPQAAGAALYVSKAFDQRFLTFLVTLAVLASGVTSAAAASRAVGGRYFRQLVEGVPLEVVAVAFILLVAVVNYRGIRETVRVNVTITFIELGGLLFIVGIGLWVLLSGRGEPAQAFTFNPARPVPLGILSGAALGFYAFLGFEDSVNLAEETHEPQRSFPLALFTGVTAASVLYLLVGFTAVMVVPLETLTRSDGPLLEVVRLGAPALPAQTAFALVGLIAVSNTALINMLMASRLLYGMARQRVLPAAFARLSARQTPVVSIVFTTALALLLIVTASDLTQLSNTTVLLLVWVFALVNVAVLVLRRDRVAHPHFRAPTLLPVLGAAVALVMALPPQQSLETYGRALVLLLVGVALYLLNAAALRPRRAARSGG